MATIELGKVSCRVCKQVVDSITLLEHYWDNHADIAKLVYDQRRKDMKKLITFQQVADEGMIGFKEVKDV